LTASTLSPRALGLWAALFAAAADQLHKFWMLDVFGIETKQPIRLAPFLDVMLSWNHGVSYSLFPAHEGFGRAMLLGAQAVIIAILLVWLWRASDRLTGLALGLVIGGALGNATDRLARGAVADFFYLHTTLPVGPLANYVFNIADVAITAGVALLLFDSFRSPGPPAERAP
jgi:signal peptidase II